MRKIKNTSDVDIIDRNVLASMWTIRSQETMEVPDKVATELLKAYQFLSDEGDGKITERTEPTGKVEDEDTTSDTTEEVNTTEEDEQDEVIEEEEQVDVSRSRDDLNEIAEAKGIDFSMYKTKQDLVDEINK